jgi:hypothetical protein
MNELKPLILRNIQKVYYLQVGQNSAVGIATGYGLDVPGIEPRWGGGEMFRTRPDRPLGPPSLQYNGYRVSSRG